MNKKFIIFLLTLSIGMLFANNAILLNSNNNQIELIENRANQLNISYQMDKINSFNAKTQNGEFASISIEGFSHSTKIGEPKLPVSRKIISVPLNAEVSATMLSSTKETYKLQNYGINTHILPAQESVSKSAELKDLQFEMNHKIYSTDELNSDPIVSVTELGIMRGMRLFTVEFAPVKYNPVTNEIVVYNNAEVQIVFSGSDFARTTDLRERTYSPYFEKNYAKSIMNYTKNVRDEITNYPVSYIIISDPMFEDQLAPFIEWKTAKGFNVITAYTDEIGTSTSSIKSYIQGLYDSATAENPAPSFVLFVGDVAQIPAYNGSAGGQHITDLNYVKLDGNDYLPEMYYGRFSANNANELQPQIDKSLEHERFEMPDPSYLAEVVMIAGVDSGYAPTHGNGAINYGTQQYFNEAHGIESHTYLYPASGSSEAQVISDISNGVGYANYTAHGGPTEWSNPQVTNADINSLNNEHMYPVVVGNCCLTNKFEVQTCFGEAWLRAEDKGAIAYIGGTNSTYWDEDYYWAVGAGPIDGDGATYEQTGIGVYDGLFHEHAEPFADWFTTTGGMIVNGNLAVVEGNGNSNYYWEIYSIMGDPSIGAYLGVPTENPATYNDVLLIGIPTLEISDAAPYSLCAISDAEGNLIATAITDENGNGSLDVASVTIPQDLSLVITAQNTQPVFATIGVIPNEGAYVVLEDFTINDDNNNIPEFGETFSFNLDFSNVGSEAATGLSASITCDDEYLFMLNDSMILSDIESNSTESAEQSFSVMLSDRIPNDHAVVLNLEITSDNDVWNTTINFLAAAPKLEISLGQINDANGNNNGIIEPGETVNISVNIANIGNAIAENVFTYLSVDDTNITITDNSYENGTLINDNQTTATFEAIVSNEILEGTNIQFGFIAESNYYNNQNSIVLPIGLVQEGFESGNFDTFDWSFAGQLDWTIDSTESNSGTYSAKSGTITHSQTSDLILVVDVVSDGQLSFYRKVSSEGNYDFLKFYINGTQMDEWSDDQDWAIFTYDVTAGENVFKWSYTKDGSVSGGSDCAWIDDITFPGFGAVSGPSAWIDSSTIDFEVVPVDQTSTKSLTLANFGNETLSGTINTIAGFEIANIGSGRENFEIDPYSNIIFEITFLPTEEINYSGNIEITTNDENFTINLLADTTDNGQDSEIPQTTKLYGNYPNPFNPETSISFGLAEKSNVKIEIYNILGQKVKTLINNKLDAGNHSVKWTGLDSSNHKVASGVYFYKLKTNNYSNTKKMLILK